jgi:hypothetical protein
MQGARQLVISRWNFSPPLALGEGQAHLARAAASPCLPFLFFTFTDVIRTTIDAPYQAHHSRRTTLNAPDYAQAKSPLDVGDALFEPDFPKHSGLPIRCFRPWCSSSAAAGAGTGGK